MPASCSAASPASRARSAPLRSGYRPNRTIPDPGDGHPVQLHEICVDVAQMLRRLDTDHGVTGLKR